MSGALHDVIEVQPRGGHALYLRFDDGTDGTVDLGTVISFTGIFTALADPSEFARVRVDPELGTICWPNGADIAPETLYAAVNGIDLGTHSEKQPSP